jgi:hypothetical protein
MKAEGGFSPDNGRQKAEDYFRKLMGAVIQMAQEQIGEVGESLRGLVKLAEQEKPDAIFFLDKGARIFALPVHKHLRDHMADPPAVKFTNDKALKCDYYEGEGIREEDILEKYEGLKGAKCFFVDETFSSGVGAVVVKNIKETLGNDDIFYVALSTNPEAGKKTRPGKFSPEEHAANLAAIRADDHFVIYPPQFETLFSKHLAPLYVREEWNQDGTQCFTTAGDDEKPEAESGLDAGEGEAEVEELDHVQEALGIKKEYFMAEYHKQIPETIQIIQAMISQELAKV